MTKQHIVFLTGAGISVESGLSTFRGKDGLWTNEEWAYLASIHLHGELSKVCSMDNRTTCVKEYPLTTPIMVGDKADDGSQLRPYIVMFGEYVDSMNVAIKYVSYADIFVVIGTSLQVYPAAGFINYAHHEVPKFVIDPGDMDQCTQLGFTHFKTTATDGMKMLLEAFKEL